MERCTTHPDGARTAKLCLQPILVRLGDANLVGVVELGDSAEAEDTDNETAHEDKSPAGLEVVIVVERQGSENIMILVNRLAVVAPVLLVEPVAVGITLRSQLGRGVDVATILHQLAPVPSQLRRTKADHVGVGELSTLGIGEGGPDLGELGLWASDGGDEGSGKRASRYNAPGEHAGGG